MKIFRYIVFFFSFLVFIYSISNIEKWIDGNKSLLKEINTGYSGVIIDSISYREGIYAHYLVRRNDLDDTILSYVYKKKLNTPKVGDSIFKRKASPYTYLIRSNKLLLSRMILIDYEIRLDKKFPEEWRCKWLETSEHDSLSEYRLDVLSICGEEEISP